MKLVEITLNSFVRRTKCSNDFKKIIHASGAKLTRKGRSRHWTLQIGQPLVLDLISLIYQSNENSWYWVAKLLEGNRAALSLEELLLIAKKEPSITVNELMSKTDCTLGDARKVLDQLEWE